MNLSMETNGQILSIPLFELVFIFGLHKFLWQWVWQQLILLCLKEIFLWFVFLKFSYCEEKINSNSPCISFTPFMGIFYSLCYAPFSTFVFKYKSYSIYFCWEVISYLTWSCFPFTFLCLPYVFLRQWQELNVVFKRYVVHLYDSFNFIPYFFCNFLNKLPTFSIGITMPSSLFLLIFSSNSTCSIYLFFRYNW